MNIETLTRHTNVLIATAHGDDFEMHFSGAAHALQEHGTEVRSVVATDGDATTLNYSGSPLATPLDVARRRRAESVAAHAVQGLAAHYLGLPDGMLHNSHYLHALAQSLSTLAVLHDVSAIITFNPEDGYCGHGDHQAIGRAALNARHKLRAENHLIDLFYINSDHQGDIKVPVHAQRKLALLALHRTQMQIHADATGRLYPDQAFWHTPERQIYHPLLTCETYDQVPAIAHDMARPYARAAEEVFI